MTDELKGDVVDTLTLRFTGEDENGVAIHELRAAHVAEVLQGLVGLTSDFDKAGVFSTEGPGSSEVLVRPAQQGSFLIEVVRIVTENWGSMVAVGSAVGIPSLSTVIWWATKSARAEVKDFDYLDNGNVKITWQDESAQEVPAAAWAELNKRDRRRKKQLRQIMAPLSDPQVSELEIASPPESEIEQVADHAPEKYVLTRPDYDAVRSDDEIEETQEVFEVEAQMSAIDFDDPTKWRVKTKDRKRSATVEDQELLGRVARGLAIRKSDIFRLRIREDATKKNGRTRTVWTVLRVENDRRVAHDNDS
jgi:hypothetical protein